MSISAHRLVTTFDDLPDGGTVTVFRGESDEGEQTITSESEFAKFARGAELTAYIPHDYPTLPDLAIELIARFEHSVEDGSDEFALDRIRVADLEQIVDAVVAHANSATVRKLAKQIHDT